MPCESLPLTRLSDGGARQLPPQNYLSLRPRLVADAEPAKHRLRLKLIPPTVHHVLACTRKPHQLLSSTVYHGIFLPTLRRTKRGGGRRKKSDSLPETILTLVQSESLRLENVLYAGARQVPATKRESLGPDLSLKLKRLSAKRVSMTLTVYHLLRDNVSEDAPYTIIPNCTPRNNLPEASCKSPPLTRFSYDNKFNFPSDPDLPLALKRPNINCASSCIHNAQHVIECQRRSHQLPSPPVHHVQRVRGRPPFVSYTVLLWSTLLHEPIYTPYMMSYIFNAVDPQEHVSSLDWVMKMTWQCGCVRGYYPACVSNTRQRNPG